MSTAIFEQSERFRMGWTAGFYDARSDDGLRYLDDILRYGVQDNEERRRFLTGYRAGRAARIGTFSESTGVGALVDVAA